MKHRNQKGYTLIELIVTISVLVFLAAMLIVLNRSTEDNFAFFRESNRFLNSFIEARRQSIFTGGQSSSASPPLTGRCSYGIHLQDTPPNTSNQDGFVVFRDTYDHTPGLTFHDCNQKYDPANGTTFPKGEEVYFFSLPPQIIPFKAMAWDTSRPLDPDCTVNDGHCGIHDITFETGTGKAFCYDGATVKPCADPTTGHSGQVIIYIKLPSDPTNPSSAAVIQRRVVISQFGGIDMDNFQSP